jgi:putative membrane protein
MSADAQAFAVGFPLALAHLGVSFGLLVLGVGLYALISPLQEVRRIREGDTAAAVSFGGLIFGLTLPLAASLIASTSTVDVALWGGAAVALTLLVFRIIDMVFHGLPERQKEGDIGAAGLLVVTKIAAALILAAGVAG